MAKFLSEAWFIQVEQLTQQAGDLNIPKPLQDLKINLIVDTVSEQVNLHLKDGKISAGLTDATVELSLSEELLRKIFFEFDTKAAISGFMLGKIKVKGDMGQLMALQMSKPSPEQKNLFKKILEISE